MTDISQEQHVALVKVAVAEATSATDAALATKVSEAAAATAKVEEAEKAAADLKVDNERLNKELDEAQLKIKAAEDRAQAAEDELKKSKEDASLAEVAAKRVEQVKGLNLFKEDFITERADRWSKQSDEDWAQQVAEWQALKPASADEVPPGDQASALSGTSTDGLSTEKETDSAAAGDTTKPSARRSALGLRAKP